MMGSIVATRRSRAAAALLPPLLAIASGAILGLSSGVADMLPWYAGGLLNIAGPWLAVAFAIGAIAPRAGFLNGALSLATAVGFYYWFHNEVTQRTDTERLVIVGTTWLYFALAVGAVTGLIGGWWAARRSAIPIGLLTGAIAGEAIQAISSHDERFMLDLTPFDRLAGQTLLLGELSIALLLPLLMLRATHQRIAAYLIALIAAAITIVAIEQVDLYLETIRG